MQAKSGRANKLPVIVRAWGDEPVKLFLHRIENNRCYVGSEETDRPIGLPLDQVFWFDVDRFHSLSTAFHANDARKLGELWAKMPVDDYACNKYRDNIKSLHDQEHIADLEGSSKRHD